MADYNVMLKRTYGIPVEQYIIYLGASKPQMPTYADPSYKTTHANSLATYKAVDFLLPLRFVDWL